MRQGLVSKLLYVIHLSNLVILNVVSLDRNMDLNFYHLTYFCSYQLFYSFIDLVIFYLFIDINVFILQEKDALTYFHNFKLNQFNLTYLRYLEFPLQLSCHQSSAKSMRAFELWGREIQSERSNVDVDWGEQQTHANVWNNKTNTEISQSW